MKLYIVVMRDSVADVFGMPNFVASLGSAVRSFGDECQRPHSVERPNPLNQHPADFELFHVGSYDDATCTFEIHEPRSLALGSSYKS